MQLKNNLGYIALLLCFVLMLMLSFVPMAYAAESNHTLTESVVNIGMDSGNRVNLYANDSTPITVQFLLDNSEYNVHLSTTRSASLYIGDTRLMGVGANTVLNSASVASVASTLEDAQLDETIALVYLNASYPYNTISVNYSGNFETALNRIIRYVGYAGEIVIDLVKDTTQLLLDHPLLLVPIAVTFMTIGVVFAKSVIRV